MRMYSQVLRESERILIHRDTVLVPIILRIWLVCRRYIDIVQKINAIHIHMKVVATARHIVRGDFNTKTLYLPTRSGHVKCTN